MKNLNKSHTINFYMDKIREFDWVEFDKLECISLEGEIRRPYPYQWYAYTKYRPGDDDPFEGVGGSPFEAVRDLYRTLKKVEITDDTESEPWGDAD
jgi:hypothetical protein